MRFRKAIGKAMGAALFVSLFIFAWVILGFYGALISFIATGIIVGWVSIAVTLMEG